jgi:5-methylcytosine-specific restriction enzyme subunit McrC
VSVSLYEWETREIPKETLDGPSQIVASHLAQSGLLELTELRHGLRVRSFSHIGRVRVGGLDIVVRPKIAGVPLLNLLRYAYGFRRLKLFDDVSHVAADCGLEDLLVHQLIAEVQDLVSRAGREAGFASRFRSSRRQ